MNISNEEQLRLYFERIEAFEGKTTKSLKEIRKEVYADFISKTENFIISTVIQDKLVSLDQQKAQAYVMD